MEYMVYFMFFGFLLTPLIIIFIIYGYIFHVVRVRLRAHSSSSVDIPATGMSGYVLKDGILTREHIDDRHRSRFLLESKATKRIFMVIVMFTLCWLPIHVMNTVTLFLHRTSYPAVIVGIILTHVNSAINPLLYAYSNKKFSEAFRTDARNQNWSGGNF